MKTLNKVNLLPICKIKHIYVRKTINKFFLKVNPYIMALLTICAYYE
jgi:hypothetical protein